MLFKNKPHSPVLVLTKFLKLLNKIRKCADKLDSDINPVWNRLKVAYYATIKYNKLRRYAGETFKKDLDIISNDETNFITILIQYFSFVAFYAGVMRLSSVNDLVHSVFKDADIYTNTDNITDVSERIKSPIYRFTAIMRSNESFMDYKNKFTVTKITANLESATYELEQNIYDCNTYFDSKTARVLYHAYFKIGEDGDIHNPNYVFDESLKEDDYEKYDFMIYHLMRLFGQIMINSIDLKINFKKNDELSKFNKNQQNTTIEK